MNIEAENAVMREKARIRTAILKKAEKSDHMINGMPVLELKDILAILKP